MPDAAGSDGRETWNIDEIKKAAPSREGIIAPIDT